VLPRRSRGQAQATRGDNDRPQGQLACGVSRVPCSCLCVETPAVAHRCFALPLPRSSILCGCISISLAGKQLMRYGVNALPEKKMSSECKVYWAACAMYVYGGSGLVDKQNISRLRVELDIRNANKQWGADPVLGAATRAYEPRIRPASALSPRPRAAGTEEGQRSQPRCRSGSRVTGHRTQRPRGQVGPRVPRTTPSPTQLLTGPRGRTVDGSQYPRLWPL
jgi:hypothetical protein